MGAFIIIYLSIGVIFNVITISKDRGFRTEVMDIATELSGYIGNELGALAVAMIVLVVIAYHISVWPYYFIKNVRIVRK